MDCRTLQSGSELKIITKAKSLIRPYDIAREDFQYRIFKLFGGYKEFWKKVGIFLKVNTGSSCRFNLERFTHDFLVLRIRKPCEYRKGVKLVELADFFGVVLAERSSAGGEHRSPSPVYLFGGGGGG